MRLGDEQAVAEYVTSFCRVQSLNIPAASGQQSVLVRRGSLQVIEGTEDKTEVTHPRAVCINVKTSGLRQKKFASLSKQRAFIWRCSGVQPATGKHAGDSGDMLRKRRIGGFARGG
jgi:hypothetical protein